MYPTKSTKCFWLLAPTQLFTHCERAAVGWSKRVARGSQDGEAHRTMMVHLHYAAIALRAVVGTRRLEAIAPACERCSRVARRRSWVGGAEDPRAPAAHGHRSSLFLMHQVARRVAHRHHPRISEHRAHVRAKGQERNGEEREHVQEALECKAAPRQKQREDHHCAPGGSIKWLATFACVQ